MIRARRYTPVLVDDPHNPVIVIVVVPEADGIALNARSVRHQMLVRNDRDPLAGWERGEMDVSRWQDKPEEQHERTDDRKASAAEQSELHEAIIGARVSARQETLV